MNVGTKKRRTKTTSDNGFSAVRVLDKYVIGPQQYRELPLTALIVDHAYQRDISEVAIKRIVSGFDWNLLEPPTVNRRTWTKKEQYALIDGQHRKEALKRIGMASVTCRVVEVDRVLEGKLFVELNRQRLWVSPLVAFRAEIDSKNPAALEVQHVIESRGLAAGSPRDDGSTVAAVSALRKIYGRRGSVGLGRTLDAVMLAWRDDSPRRFHGQILSGVDAFLGKSPKVEPAVLAEKLARVTPELLLAKANQRWHGYHSIGSHSKSVVDCVAEEIGRAYRKR